MKHFKQLVNEIKALSPERSNELEQLLWPYICYSPKMPLRLSQEQLLQEAEQVGLSVNDEYFANKVLQFNSFKWGQGKHRLLITHGWGSKAADFADLITALRTLPDLEIISFDAPGNGSSEGELSNLLLYVQAVKATILHYGNPDVVIGHSLGGMANVMALREMQLLPDLLISITPLVRLKEHFIASMNAVQVPEAIQAAFLASFEGKYGVPVSIFTLDNWYKFDGRLNHLLIYDSQDAVSPYEYMRAFFDQHPSIKSTNYAGIGHEKVFRSAEVIGSLVEVVKEVISFK